MSWENCPPASAVTQRECFPQLTGGERRALAQAQPRELLRAKVSLITIWALCKQVPTQHFSPAESGFPHTAQRKFLHAEGAGDPAVAQTESMKILSQASQALGAHTAVLDAQPSPKSEGSRSDRKVWELASAGAESRKRTQAVLTSLYQGQALVSAPPMLPTGSELSLARTPGWAPQASIAKAVQANEVGAEHHQGPCMYFGTEASDTLLPTAFQKAVKYPQNVNLVQLKQWKH